MGWDAVDVRTDVEAPAESRSRGRTRVLVVDDHRTFAGLLSRALDAEPDLVCVGHAQDAGQAVEAVGRLAPDVVLMDLRLPDQDGITTTADITSRDPDIKVLILTAHASPAELTRAGAAGASGLLSKDGTLDDILASWPHPRPDSSASVSEHQRGTRPVDTRTDLAAGRGFGRADSSSTGGRRPDAARHPSSWTPRLPPIRSP